MKGQFVTSQKITIIVAYCKENRIIGKDGQMPWHLPEDLNHFKQVTLNSPVILGRKTWDSIPEKFKPLPNRINIVITREQKDFPLYYDRKEPFWASSLEDAIRIAQVSDPGKEIFLIGGGQIYQQALDQGLVDKVIASEVKKTYEGDTFFPNLDWEGILLKEFKEFNVILYSKTKPVAADR